MNDTPEKESNVEEAERVAKAVARPKAGDPYPNSEHPRSRIGNVHNPKWVLIHAPNARWKNGVVNTEFWNRAARRHLVYEEAPKE
jgi:hypothetical protein